MLTPPGYYENMNGGHIGFVMLAYLRVAFIDSCTIWGNLFLAG